MEAMDVQESYEEMPESSSAYNGLAEKQTHSELSEAASRDENMESQPSQEENDVNHISSSKESPNAKNTAWGTSPTLNGQDYYMDDFECPDNVHSTTTIGEEDSCDIPLTSTQSQETVHDTNESTADSVSICDNKSVTGNFTAESENSVLDDENIKYPDSIISMTKQQLNDIIGANAVAIVNSNLNVNSQPVVEEVKENVDISSTDDLCKNLPNVEENIATENDVEVNEQDNVENHHGSLTEVHHDSEKEENGSPGQKNSAQQSEEEPDSEDSSEEEVDGLSNDEDDEKPDGNSESEPETLPEEPEAVKMETEAVTSTETLPEEAKKPNGVETVAESETAVESEINDAPEKEEKQAADQPKPEEGATLRRSSRNVIRKRYDKDEEEEEEKIKENGREREKERSKYIESDLIEIFGKDALKKLGKNKSIVSPTEKKTVSMPKITKIIANNFPLIDKDLTIIPSNSKTLLLPLKKPTPIAPKPSFTLIPANLPSQALYQSIAARGTTVTPVINKPVQPQIRQMPVPAPPPQIILPSLTDDMFVVEAPSFIVPYVYEKPPVKGLRSVVDALGKELHIKHAKDEMESKPVILTDPLKLDTEVGAAASEENGSKKKGDRMKSKRRHEDDDDSWDGESTPDSEDMSDDDRCKTVIIKKNAEESMMSMNMKDFSVDSTGVLKSDSYFDSSLGSFFINIGANLVQEHVQNDLLKQQQRKLYREKKSGSANVPETESVIASLSSNILYSKITNAPFKHPRKKCPCCNFKTESALTLEHHMETPHMSANVYKCNYCPFDVKSPQEILRHMDSLHGVRGRLERAPAYHLCANCPFEDNGKGKMARHLIACAKKFKPDHNLMPPIEWEPPAKLPKVTRQLQHSNMMSYHQNHASSRTHSPMGRPLTPSSTSHLGVNHMYRGRGRPAIMPMLGKHVQGAPIVRGGVIVRASAPNQIIPRAGTSASTVTSNGHQAGQYQPSISITPLPPQAGPSSAPAAPPSPDGDPSNYVMCEICDGYIRDLEQLRNHMQWIHKVKIHPKMMYNRPPLNCQKCQFRFFTDQGLERHLLGTHGLVTSFMQEAANEVRDGGRCPICGRAYQWKLLNHVAKDHNMTLKPAHLSYKCTVCTASFSMYKQFENHVYTAHCNVARRNMDRARVPDGQPRPGTSGTQGSSGMQAIAGPSGVQANPARAHASSTASSFIYNPLPGPSGLQITPSQPSSSFAPNKSSTPVRSRLPPPPGPSMVSPVRLVPTSDLQNPRPAHSTSYQPMKINDEITIIPQPANFVPKKDEDK